MDEGEGDKENWVDDLTKYSSELVMILNDLGIVKPGYSFDVVDEVIYEEISKPKRDQSPKRSGGSRSRRRSRSRRPIPSQVIIGFILKRGEIETHCEAVYKNKRSPGNPTDVVRGLHSNIKYGSGNFIFHLQLLIILLHVRSIGLDNMTDSPERAARGIYSLLNWVNKAPGPDMVLRETTDFEDVFNNFSKKIKIDSDPACPWVEDVEDKIKEFISILKNEKEAKKYEIQHAIEERTRYLGKKEKKNKSKKKKKKKKSKRKSKTRGKRR